MTIPREEYQFLQAGSGRSIAVDEQREFGRLEPHPTLPHVFMETTRDGVDLIASCDRHLWASPAGPMLSACPECLAGLDNRRGRRRYEDLMTRLSLGI